MEAKMTSRYGRSPPDTSVSYATPASPPMNSSHVRASFPSLGSQRDRDIGISSAPVVRHAVLTEFHPTPWIRIME
jgi:hypothetical protein